MIGKILSGGVVLIALAAPASAQDQCVTPTAPTIPDGAKATPAQIVAAQNDIKAFATASDQFQACIAHEIVRQKDVAKQTNVEFDPNIQTSLESKGAAQRRDVDRIATAWGASVQAFNDAQKRKPRQADPRSQPNAGGGYGGGYGGGKY
jgi:hypothetical protein